MLFLFNNAYILAITNSHRMKTILYMMLEDISMVIIWFTDSGFSALSLVEAFFLAL